MRIRRSGVAIIAAAILAVPAASASAGGQTPNCSIQGVVLEQFALSNGRNYARLIGLGNCGRGYAPTYSWKHLTVRENGKLRHLRLVGNTYETQFRLQASNALVRGAFELSYGSSVTDCSFTLSRNNYEHICP